MKTLKNCLLLTIIFVGTEFSSFGQTLRWARMISGIDLDNINGMTTDASGNVYVVGTFTGTIDFVSINNIETYAANYSDVWFAKYSSTGQFIWGKALVGGSHDIGKDIAVDNSGNVYITGSHGGTLDFNPSPRTVNALTVSGSLTWSFVAKYTTDGNYIWAKNIGTGTNVFSQGKGITIDATGAIYVVGDFNPQINFQSGSAVFGGNSLNASSGNAYFVKLNSSNGDIVWAKNVGNSPSSTSPSTCEDITVTIGNNIYITGFFTGQNVDFNPALGTVNYLNSNSSTVYVAKFNSAGDHLYSTNTIGTPNPVGKTGMSIDNDTAGNAYLIVSNEQNISQSDISVIKYNNTLGLLASKTINNPNTYDGGLAIDAEPDGGAFYISGYLNSTGTPVDFNSNANSPVNVTIQANRNDIFYAKYNSTSSSITCQYAKVMGINGFGENFGKASVKSTNGSLYVAGWFSSPTDFDPCFTGNNFTPNGFSDSFIAAYIANDQPPSIVGPSLVCNGSTNSTFNIPNLSPNASISWTQSSNLTTVSGQGTATYTVAPLNSSTSGIGIVTATVGGPCGFTISKEVWVGLPSIVYHAPGTNPCTDNPYYEGPVGPNLTYSWSVDNPNVWFTTSPSLRNAAVISYNPEYFNITLTISDGLCSTSISQFSYTAGYYCLCFSDPSCSGGQLMSVSPNPSSNTIKVSLKENPKSKTTLSFLNDSGKCLFSLDLSSKETPIDISNIQNGTYYLALETLNKKETVRINISH